MALPPLLRVPGPDPFSSGLVVGYGQMAIGEKVRYEVTRDAQGVLVTVIRTTANGIISGSARVAGTTVTKPSSQVTFGRIPTSRPPDEEPPPAPPPGVPGTVPNWHPFAGTFTVGSPDITTTSDGSQAYVTMNSDDGYVDDGAVGRVFTGSVQIKGTGSSIDKTAYLIFRERRSDGSTPSNDGAAVSIVLTGAYQTLTSTYTATELNSAMDLRVTLRGVTTGEAFIVSAVPTFSYQDPVSAPPVANFTISPASPTTTDTVWFYDSSYATGATLTMWEWDVNNDGAWDIRLYPPGPNSASISNLPAGARSASLTVTDSLGRTNKITKTFTVTSGSPPANVPPVASFTYSPSNPIATDTVTFTDTSSDSDGTIASRAWDLDNDGAYDDSTSATPTKVFGAAGTYTVGLRVTDDDGATNTTSRTIVVANTAPTPTADPFTRPYYPSALINSNITTLGVRSDSAAAVSRLQACVASGKVQTAITGESPTIYVSNHATQNLYSTPYGNWYLPSNAVNGGGSDHPLVIRDANHPNYGPYSELRIWQANINHSSRTITGSGAGVFHFNNDGVRYGGIHSVGRPIAGTGPGNGLNYTAGMILVADVVNGVIPHTMRFAYGPSSGPGTASSPTSSGKVDPATKSDQAGTLSGAVPMGTRFRLKSSVDITTRTVPGKSNSSTEWRFLQIFLRACQDYGIMVSDGTGSGPNFYFESSYSANPSWSSVIGTPDPTTRYGYILRDNTVSDSFSGQRTAFSGVPWGQFEVVSNTTENL